MLNMSSESTSNSNPFTGEDESPAKNMATAKNRQRSPVLLNENFANASCLLTSSPLHFDWQSNRFCVSERVRRLFANTMLADVYFNIHYRPGCDSAPNPFIHNKYFKDLSFSSEIMVQRIPAHSFILAISSAVFEAMFYGPMSIQNSSRSAPAVSDDQSVTESTEQTMIKQTSRPLLSSPLTTSLSSSSEHMHIDSSKNLNSLEKETRRQPLVFNPSSSQINPNNPIEVHVDDVSPVAFINMLRFIYTDEIQIDASNVFQTLYVSKKYAINGMENACFEFLSQSISVENAFLVLSHANFFNEQQLAQKCLEVIDKNTARVFDTEDFLTADKDLLLNILERDTLCIRESRLFTSILKWAKAEYLRIIGTESEISSPSSTEAPQPTTSSIQSPSSNSLSRSNITASQATELPNLSNVPQDSLRQILQPLLPHIRFPQMSIEEFANLVVPSGVLCNDMVVKIFQYFIAAKNIKPELPFVKRPRCYLHDAEEVVQRFMVVDQRWDYRGTSDRIRFKVDRKIHLVGFGLYGSIHGECDYEASIEVSSCFFLLLFISINQKLRFHAKAAGLLSTACFASIG
ncbi:unnamed protein product [Rodentolepis nana]|uniref:BTB domain-containing protein n=1 Tax=Rodentolepis nana TaxID=102285 RepID=A0A3P7SFK1_RODNA|nr:unnamed protein product [Rodentolepis nana]